MWEVKRLPLAQLPKQQEYLQISKALEYAASAENHELRWETLDDCSPLHFILHNVPIYASYIFLS